MHRFDWRFDCLERNLAGEIAPAAPPRQGATPKTFQIRGHLFFVYIAIISWTIYIH